MGIGMKWVMAAVFTASDESSEIVSVRKLKRALSLLEDALQHNFETFYMLPKNH